MHVYSLVTMRSRAKNNIETPTIILPAVSADKILIQKCKLLAVTGPVQGQEFVMETDVFSIGSDTHNDLQLDDAGISRRHVEIQLTEDGYEIRDLGSTNGTFVQGVRIVTAYLDEGTEFQIGNSRLVFCPLRESAEFEVSRKESFGSVLGASVPMRRVFHLAERYSRTDTTILLQGETGTGKEILADEIHKHSLRNKRPFVVIDCASLAGELIESELFGHVKGSFTGAAADRQGAFEFANGGTVFLDEIGDLSKELQPKLLRVLEKREIKRVGSNKVIPVNVRIIAATNRKLENEVNADRFREDLFYRLSVVSIELPPLRRRTGDILLLAKKFIEEFHGKGAIERISDFETTMDTFSRHDWPGNVRELRNLMEVVSFEGDNEVDLRTFLYLGRMHTTKEDDQVTYAADKPFKEAKNALIADFEKSYIQDLLQRHDGNISRAARTAGIERAYLQRILKKYR
jgi:transcriptional regulator with PAS, ATPase and Fis domain